MTSSVISQSFIKIWDGGLHFQFFLVKLTPMWGRPVDFRFNADPVALKLVTHSKIVFRADTGLCLSRLKCKRKACCVAVTDSFTLINVSTMTARCSPVQFMAAKETKNNGIIKKQSKWALYGKMALYVLFKNKNTFLLLYFIRLLFNLQMCQNILPDPYINVYQYTIPH